jgi:superfamily II DNA/RNA helicase
MSCSTAAFPGDKRGALVDRFNNDPACRLFLSTDAGGVGLNLQHAAAVVVNMDLPWNPAVLEQRIGRVHRLGQTRGVQVINFVARERSRKACFRCWRSSSRCSPASSMAAKAKSSCKGRACRSSWRRSKRSVRRGGSQSASEDDARTRAARSDGSMPRTKPTARPNTSAQRPPTRRQHRPLPNAPRQRASAAGHRDRTGRRRSLGAAAGRRRATARRALSGARASVSRPGYKPTRRPERYLKLPMPDPQTIQRLAEGLLSLLDGLPGTHDIRSD